MKRVLLGTGIFVAIVLPLLCLIFIYPKKVIQIRGNDYIFSEELQWGIKEQKLGNGQYSFNGWVLLPGVEQGYAVLENKSIWVRDIEENKFYKLKAQQINGRDTNISTIVDDGLDYQSSSFSVGIDTDSLDIENKDYEIYICYQCYGQNYLTPINAYIIDKNLIQK